MNNNKGFTLIEMLVVVAIIGLLSSVVVIGLGGARSKSRDARRVADIQQAQTALEVGYTAATGYPTYPSNAPVNDPQGKPYVYNGAGTQTYKLGICMENVDNAIPSGDVLTKCPGGLSCTNYYCVTQ